MHHKKSDSGRVHRFHPTRLTLALHAAALGLLLPAAARAQDTPDAPAPVAETTLPSVKVRSRTADDAGPVRGFVPKHGNTATKTDTPLVETPQSISVVGSDEMAARGVTSVTEAVRYTPGLLAETYGNDDRGIPWFSIRGFEDIYTSSYLDGLRQPASSYTIQINEAFGLERIEVLRGPSSVMFGQVDAGGIVNRVRKLPSAETVREVRVQAGNFGRKEFGVDVGGPLVDDGSVQYRLIASGQATDAQAEYPGFDAVTRKRAYVAPSLSWKPGSATTLTLLGEYTDQKGPNNTFEYIGADLRRTGLLAGEPGYDKLDQRQWNAGYQFEHRFDDTWSVRQNLRTADTRVDMRSLYGPGFDSADADTGEITQRANVFQQQMRYTAVDTQAVGHLRTGGMEHTAVFGLDYMHSDFETERLRGPGPSLNVTLPPLGQYGQPVTTPTDVWSSSTEKVRQLGVYAQDQLKLGERWRVTLGGRFDRAQAATVDRLGEEPNADNTDRAFTGRAGVNYVLPNGLVPYASFTSSFLPQTGTDINSTAFDPTRGKQYELGVKFQPADTDALVTLALFDLTKSNVLTVNPDNTDYQQQTGEIRSRGVEIEGKVSLAQGLRLNAQYTYTDIEVTESTGEDLGKRPINAPKQMAAAWVDYTFADSVVQGLGLGAGLRYVGQRYADNINTVSTPSYTLVDAAARYATGPWLLALNVNNVFDREYVASYAFGYYAGVRRTARLTATYRW